MHFDELLIRQNKFLVKTEIRQNKFSVKMEIRRNEFLVKMEIQWIVIRRIFIAPKVFKH